MKNFEKTLPIIKEKPSMMELIPYYHSVQKDSNDLNNVTLSGDLLKTPLLLLQ